MKRTSTQLFRIVMVGAFLLFSGSLLKAQCSANFTFSVNGLTVTFTNTSTNFTPNAQWSWTFGDAGTSNLQNPSHTYAAAGTYTVCVGGADLSPFCADTACHVIMLVGINDLQTANGSISNYPNPFTSSTTIDYTLNEQGSVEVAVYDVLGNKVTTLENTAHKLGGSYKLEFDGTNYKAGIYFLRLTLNGQSVTQKMTLVK